MNLEQDNVYDREKWQLKFLQGDSTVLENKYDIAEILMFMRDIEAEIDQLKELKKARVSPIETRLEAHDQQLEFFRKIIALTLISNKQKSLVIPGLGSVSQRKKSHKWIITDEEALCEVLKKEKEYDQIVKEETVRNINKKELNKLLDTWDGIDKPLSGVQKELPPDDGTGGIGVTIKLDKEPVLPVKDVEVDKPNLQASDFDKLTV